MTGHKRRNVALCLTDHQCKVIGYPRCCALVAQAHRSVYVAGNKIGTGQQGCISIGVVHQVSANVFVKPWNIIYQADVLPFGIL